ncbi:MAG: hypothetical protein HYZ63_04205 [Candidatus Andersenbacteria bacterium]|nr:hypothetical protein [Candidatus Andersenbacteria bacterium]
MQEYETVVMQDLGFFQDAEEIVSRLKRQGIDATEAAGHILVEPDEAGRARQLIGEAEVAMWAREDRTRMFKAKALTLLGTILSVLVVTIATAPLMGIEKAERAPGGAILIGTGMMWSLARFCGINSPKLAAFCGAGLGIGVHMVFYAIFGK